ncbi:2-alkyl-3-oxoalkanoate reductase (plasmid) [Roseobacter fucihabitans]|uniref:2-alkyl-3-oxoalkanoate reductase n=1 Tax=Roseobacter fucihabitans TaxID=1537242 RepID=A0ABZ2BZN5_9RHOB|nr:NAD(P)-dependent oxidoreductase [Roseobacter litoralis]MBC6967868.1 GDP-L-fucose synthase [Roseobacter litoralis]
MSRILITGAGGFLGQALVRAARHAGSEVTALIRSTAPSDWTKDPSITTARVDLGGSPAPDQLAPYLEGVTSVIHAAASFGGTAHDHGRDTLRATRNLIVAMQSAKKPAKLVLISSFSVYDIAALPEGATLSEDSPLLGNGHGRDPYAIAKRAQEHQVQDSGLAHDILRPGAIYGPGRLWSAQLGFARAGRVICPGGHAQVPAIHVDHAATALVHAALRDGSGLVANLVDPSPPTQLEWLAAIGQNTHRVPLAAVLRVAQWLGRGPAWAARFKPLNYDLTRARDQLGPVPSRSFAQAVAAAKAQENTP